MSDAEDINKTYYNKLYRKRNSLAQLIYPYISYDQQCKSKYNIRFIKDKIKQSGKQLNFIFCDYGFGHGSLILKVPQKNNLFGCDISHEAVINFPRVASMIGKKVITFLPEQMGDATKNVRFDMISLSHVIEHIDEDDKLLIALASKLSDSGELLINVPINEVWEDPKHVRKYSLSYMTELAQKCEFKIERWQEAEKWSSFFIKMEYVKKAPRPMVIILKFMRLVLALLPLPLLRLSEAILPRSYQYQQLILVLSKK